MDKEAIESKPGPASPGSDDGTRPPARGSAPLEIEMPPSFRRSFTAVSAGALILTASIGARADESEGARLFREGRALLLAERFAEACPKLEESQRLEPRGGTLLNVAACHERVGRIATAWAEFHEAAAAARTEGHAARLSLAEQRIAALDPRLPWLTLHVSAEAAAQGVRVTFDGAEIVPAAWGKDMPIDPGSHVIAVNAPGRVEHRYTVVARESLKQTVELRGLAAPEPAPEPAPIEPVAPAEPPPPAPTAPRFGRWVFEIGLFAGYMNGSMGNARPDAGEDGIQLASLDPSGSSGTCYEIGCSFTLGRAGGLVGGVNLFAGFAASERVHFGGRMILGPRLGGGAIFATGPSVSIHVGGPVWAGASLYTGYASQSGRAAVTPPNGYTLIDNSVQSLTASTDMAFGLGFELRVELFRAGTGAFSLDTQPFFLASSVGSALVLPIGVSYRFR